MLTNQVLGRFENVVGKPEAFEHLSCEIGSDHAGCRGGKRVQVYGLREWDRARVDLEDLAPPGAIRGLNGDTSVKAARSKKSGECATW